MVNYQPAKAWDIRDTGSTSGSGRSPGGGQAIHSSILAWRISWTEEPGGLQSMRLQRVRHFHGASQEPRARIPQENRNGFTDLEKELMVAQGKDGQ